MPFFYPFHALQMAGGVESQKTPVSHVQHLNDARGELPRIGENCLLQRRRRHTRGAPYGVAMKWEKLIGEAPVILVSIHL